MTSYWKLPQAVATIAVVLMFGGCQQAESPKSSLGPQDIAAANKELVRRFYQEVFVDWNLALVDEVVSPEFRSHDWPEGGPTGAQAFRDFYSQVRSAFPDTHYEVDDLIAGGDKVVVRWRLLGTHKGDFRGIAPTGQPIELKGIAIYRVEGSKLMERWVVFDLHGLIEQIQGASVTSG
jgi:predicted ester cyclase